MPIYIDRIRCVPFVLAILCLYHSPLVAQVVPYPFSPPSETFSLSGDVKRLVGLTQNWRPEETARFYSIPHGSQLIPYSWFLALEQPGSSLLFRDYRNMLRFNFLPLAANVISTDGARVNPDGLPIGFVKDGDLDWLGLNCAACHTSQINFRGTGIRIDGAPAMTDVDSFLKEIVKALEFARAKENFPRFAGRVLGRKSANSNEVDLLSARLDLVLKRRRDYNLRNQVGNPEAPESRPNWGFGRIDAFGVILNQVTSLRLHRNSNARPANAPVSIPFLWDTPQHKTVQWNGAAENSKIIGVKFGNLGRNAGEVLGVFGEIRTGAEFDDIWIGYPTSATGIIFSLAVLFGSVLSIIA